MVFIRLYKNQDSWISRAIRWQTRGIYSHAAIAIDGIIYEAREFKGVQQRAAEKYDGRYFDDYRVNITLEQELEMEKFLRRQLGKGYDYTMVLRFITRQQETRKSTGMWFCSELVFASFQKVGINLLERCEPWEVSPALLSLSPSLKLINILNE